jgi:deazaflavin-dependent oxidoreductase (nitroreductase family)
MTANPLADWNNKNIAEFRANQGKVGGQFEGAPMVLLHTTGAKTGQERVNPLVYLQDGDRILVFASKGGFPTHPDWYRNLKKNPNVKLEVGTETYDALASEVTGEERDKVYAKQAKIMPQFAEYEQRATTRKIPVIALTRK